VDTINNLNSNPYCLNPTVAYEIKYFQQPSENVVAINNGGIHGLYGRECLSCHMTGGLTDRILCSGSHPNLEIRIQLVLVL